MPGGTGVNPAEGDMGDRGQGLPGSGEQLCPGVSAMGLLSGQGPGRGSTLAPMVCSNLQGQPTAYCPSWLGSCAPRALHSVARRGLPASRDTPSPPGRKQGAGLWGLFYCAAHQSRALASPWPGQGPHVPAGLTATDPVLRLAESAQCEVFCLLASRPGRADCGCLGWVGAHGSQHSLGRALSF